MQEAKEAVAYAQTYVDVHEEAIDELQQCAKASEKNNFLVMVLTEAYYEVAGVTLGKHLGGRTMTYTNSLDILSNWPEICKYVIASIEKRASGMFDMDSVKEELRKTTTLMLHLLEIERIQQKQSKVTKKDAADLRQHYNDLKKAFQKDYPDVTPWWKMHYGICHMPSKAEHNGMIGRLNAQGTEGTHGKTKPFDEFHKDLIMILICFFLSRIFSFLLFNSTSRSRVAQQPKCAAEVMQERENQKQQHYDDDSYSQ